MKTVSNDKTSWEGECNKTQLSCMMENVGSSVLGIPETKRQDTSASAASILTIPF